jgi:hypothetical protein
MPLDELFERRFVATARVGQKPILGHPASFNHGAILPSRAEPRDRCLGSRESTCCEMPCWRGPANPVCPVWDLETDPLGFGIEPGTCGVGATRGPGLVRGVSSQAGNGDDFPQLACARPLGWSSGAGDLVATVFRSV